MIKVILLFFIAVMTNVLFCQNGYASNVEIIVKKGDTFCDLAYQYGVPLAKFKELNRGRLKKAGNFNHIEQGQKLLLSSDTAVINQVKNDPASKDVANTMQFSNITLAEKMNKFQEDASHSNNLFFQKPIFQGIELQKFLNSIIGSIEKLFYLSLLFGFCLIFGHFKRHNSQKYNIIPPYARRFCLNIRR